MTACRVERLRLFNFRNYTEAVVEPGPGVNIFAGRNAQGKTNLLEAVATLTLTRSPRASNAADLIRWGTNQCQVEATTAGGPAPLDLSVRFELDPATRRVSRTTAIGGKGRPARAMLGACPVVLFWPDDLLLVKAGPEGRRRLLDVVLSQLEPRTAAELVRYRRAVDQRNALLKQIRDGQAMTAALEAFDQEFALHGAHVRVARAQLLHDLSPIASTALRGFGGENEALDLRYAVDELGGEPVDTVENATAALLEAARRRRSEEIARGACLVGPHRDDLEIRLGERPAKSAASQGQQRSIVLALKLAEVRYVERVAARAPVLILDDVLSELDAGRREGLLAEVRREAMQVLVTTAEPGVLEGRDFENARYFEVSNGTVRPGT